MPMAWLRPLGWTLVGLAYLAYASALLIGVMLFNPDTTDLRVHLVGMGGLVLLGSLVGWVGITLLEMAVRRFGHLPLIPGSRAWLGARVSGWTLLALAGFWALLVVVSSLAQLIGGMPTLSPTGLEIVLRLALLAALPGWWLLRRVRPGQPKAEPGTTQEASVRDVMLRHDLPIQDLKPRAVRKRGSDSGRPES